MLKLLQLMMKIHSRLMHSEISNSLEQLRSIQPLVHNITNQVVKNSTANALLAIGASPVMAHAIEEVSDMVRLAGSLVINTGTITATRLESMLAAANTASVQNKPWILDPVGAGATPFRLESNQRLLGLKPSVVRGNASEIMALFSGQSGGKGVDSSISSESTLQFLNEKAGEYNLTIAVTGKTDLIADGKRLARIKNGHPMMARVTGTGCTATALIGAFLATCPSPWQASVSALACLGIAGELAAKESKGPGSLQVNLLDQLYGLSQEKIEQYLKLEY
ncbi:hydroxyethylthiazole kinase [Endozoicomonas sp. Mp262]|uniref:hydroxyethylthiazole kinase n=1 Tax=Endozoicomonas sp. Mp262 TaxID=2919499 RepID=UPI0021D97059